MGQDRVMLSMKEAQRLGVIEQVLDKRLTQALAAQQLGVSVRQIKRLGRAVREHGALGLVSKRRGQPSNRRISQERKDAIMTLVRERYADFGPQLACEYLFSCHQQRLSAETLRGWMVQDGLWQVKKRRAKRQHPGRPRRDCLGELVQIDGSHHDWFEGRAPKCCLIAFIDDATGRVLAARFSDGETTQAYFAVLHQHVSAHGVPLACYSDRHSIFTKHNSEDPKPTQFERALLQLQIEPICAHSPQAKGRVERLFQTLQDRLCKAMRLEGISSIEQANAWLGQYMAEHNARFAVAPRQPQDAHRAYTGDAQALARICSLHHQRQLSNDQTCQFEGTQIWIKADQSQAPKGRAKVDIAQYADGRLEVLYRGQPLAFRSFVLHPHLQQQKRVDHKSVNRRVDELSKHQREQLRLKAQMELQHAMREEGIYSPDTHPSGPPLVLGRYGLRPSQSSTSS